ncbi:hypothetical protein EMIT0P265_30264 [Pseudomonas zeae]
MILPALVPKGLCVMLQVVVYEA